jgi:hypothetical protein
MKPWRAAPIAVLAALLAATATHGASSQGTLKVSERVEPSTSFYIEGAYEYLRVRRLSDSKVLLERRFELGKIKLTRRLSPGRYKVTSWTQTCSGNCGYLDPPSLDCRRTVRIQKGKTARVTVVSEVGKRCRITL